MSLINDVLRLVIAILGLWAVPCFFVELKQVVRLLKGFDA